MDNNLLTNITDLPNEITELINPGTVFVISKSYCPFCVRAKEMLLKMKIAFKCIEVDELGSKYNKHESKMNKIAGLREDCIGGCSELAAAAKNKSLYKKLEENKIPHSKL